MLTVYDLYDLHWIFTNIRNHPDDPINQTIVRCILEVIRNRNSSEETNAFRNALRAIDGLDASYSFVLTSNVYTYYPFIIKDSFVYDILSESCSELENAICLGNIDRVFDLADTLHNLPIVLSENNLSIPNRFWKVDIQSYRKKWNAKFLKQFKK